MQPRGDHNGPPSLATTASRALARFDAAARGTPGFLRRLVGSAEQSIDDVLERLLGERFDDRMARVPLALGTSGVDPFGLDPQWAKYALSTVAMLHRKYFRSEAHGIVRAMVEKWAVSLPFVSLLFTRIGQVVGVPENATRLLAQGEALLVFPEGARGIAKTFDQRYKLTEFGLGFMRLAIETDTPTVPIAVVGGEEQYISVANVEGLAKLLRVPAF